MKTRDELLKEFTDLRNSQVMPGIDTRTRNLHYLHVLETIALAKRMSDDELVAAVEQIKASPSHPKEHAPAKFGFYRDKTMQSHVLHSLEEGEPCSSNWIRNDLKRKGVNYTPGEITATLQKLRKEKIAIYTALWCLRTHPSVQFVDLHP